MLNIVLIDDHRLFLEGVKRILENNPLVSTVTIYTEPKKILPHLISHKTDFLITDLNMPEFDGIQLINRVKLDHPKLKICVLTMYYNFNLFGKLKELQIDGYLHKSMSETEFDNALETICNGEKYFSLEPAKVKQAYDLVMNDHEDIEIIKDNFIRKHLFSPREFEIFILIINNYNTTEIAEKLFLSKLTVSTYRKYIIKKSGCKTIVEMLKYANETGLIHYPVDQVLKP